VKKDFVSVCPYGTRIALGNTVSYEYLPLDESHRWKAKPNHRILVLDRGAVRLDYPEDWHVAFEDEGAMIHDHEPPADKCRLSASCERVSAELTSRPLSRILESVIAGDTRNVTASERVFKIQRPPLEALWTELQFREPTISRLACSRVCVARAGRTQAYVIFDFWPEDIVRCYPVWETVLESLEVGGYIDDPTTGQRHGIRG
jgi:hypothetical protein